MPTTPSPPTDRAAPDVEGAPLDDARPLAPCTTAELARYFLRLGATGFGGPVALAGYMQRDLVEARRWISKEEYLEGLALAQLAPGPLAAQLAIYLGWTRGGTLGATVAGLAFVMPSFLMVLVLAALYVELGGLSWMRDAFYGIGAAVIAIMARSVVKLGQMSLGKQSLLWAIAGVSAVVTAWTESEIIWVFVAGGVVVLLVELGRHPPAGATAMMVLMPDWMVAGLAGPASESTLVNIAWYFTEAGAFVFGSGLAIVPFLRVGVVERFGWLDDAQFLDAVAVAMITPGPVVITVAFIGFLAAGLLGAIVAALATFLPCWLFTVLPAPHFARFAKNARLKAFVAGVTAAATGAIAGATFVLGRRAIVDVWTVALAVATLGVILRFKKVNEPMVIVGAGVLGCLLRALAA